jgi:branched-chain amino acid aminotransferase
LAIYYVNGEFVPAEQACLPVNDLAILRGFAVFELLRTYGGRPFFLDAHIARLEDSARHIGLTVPWTRDQLTGIVGRTLARNDFAEANIRIVVTGGPSDDFMTPGDRPGLLVLVSGVPELPSRWYTEGAKIITTVLERPITGAKSINYIPATIAMAEARRKGAIEAVYVSRQGQVQEGTTSNLFIFDDQGLATPGRDILPGITRRVILDLAAPRFAVSIRDISYTELCQAREVFITGTNKGLVPVVQVDDRTIADGRPGPRTRALMAALEQRTARFATGQSEPEKDRTGLPNTARRS